MKTRKYYIKSQLTKVLVRDVEIEFDLKIAIDPLTEEEVFIRELEIENDIKLYDIYKKEKGLLQSFEIKKIREKYNLNQKDFSRLLGLGEITIHRYENGTIQTDANDSIIRFSENPQNMEKVAFKNKNKVLDVIFEELLERLKVLNNYTKHKIVDINKQEFLNLDFQTEHVEKVADKTIEIYNKKVMEQIEEYQIIIPKISNLVLQKLLYYIQGISLLIYSKEAFREHILAWEYGPIVYEIYSKYKSHKANEIDVIPGLKLSNGLESIIKIVVENYGKYTGGQLINLTHDEEPWQCTEKNNIIHLDIIKEYFEKIYEAV